MHAGERYPGDAAASGRDAARVRAESLLAELDGDSTATSYAGLNDLELVDLLFDRQQRVDDATLMELSSELLLPSLDELARRVLGHEDLLLDATRIADAAWRRIDVHLHLGKRVKPVALWMRRALEQTIAWARYEPEYCAYPMPKGDEEDARIDHELARFLNELDPVARRIVAMAWVRKLGPDVVVATTRLPLEEVEAILESALKSALRIIRGEDTKDGDGIGSAEFWRAMEGRHETEGGAP